MRKDTLNKWEEQRQKSLVGGRKMCADTTQKLVPPLKRRGKWHGEKRKIIKNNY